MGKLKRFDLVDFKIAVRHNIWASIPYSPCAHRSLLACIYIDFQIYFVFP